MIREYREADLTAVMHIWLDTNVRAHDFIPKEYWTDNFESVKELMPQAEVYVYEDEASGEIEGFIGLTDSYIAGIFVREAFRSKGIGKQLLDFVKHIKNKLTLRVYERNGRAIRFYRRELFEIQSEGIDENTGEKELLMAWSTQPFHCA